MNDSPAILSIKQLGKSYAGNRDFALTDISFEVAKGKIVALLGESGSGKTTLLRLIAGFESANEGQIHLAEKLIANKHYATPPEKRGIGMVFQDYALFPHLTIQENIAYGLHKHHNKKQRTAEVLALVGLQGMNHRYPHELSGGQQQRVALARALAPQPHLLLLDEPFSNLDEGLKAQVRRDLKQILKSTQTTAIFVTHDTQDALSGADEVILLQQGVIEQQGSPEALYHTPATLYTANYFGKVNWIAATVSNDIIYSSWGEWSFKTSNHGKCMIGIRPHQIHVAESATEGLFQAKVISCTFLGAVQEVILENSAGDTLEAYIPANISFIINEIRHWKLHLQEVLYFSDSMGNISEQLL